jgi:CHAT domain-containing protein
VAPPEKQIGRGDRKPSLLAFGNPTPAAATRERMRSLERGPALGDLPEAESEVRAIGRLYPQHHQVRVGLAATERLFKEQAGRYDVLHLATHGLLDDASAMFSAVLLSAGPPSEDEDGLLEAREVAELRLSARLAVLSACETGRGTVRLGEGLVGMSWALLAAGVSTTVVSDWKTDSAATEQLMVELHRQLLAGKSTPEALRQAQLSVLANQRWKHPYYWAPFVVVGAY